MKFLKAPLKLPYRKESYWLNDGFEIPGRNHFFNQLGEQRPYPSTLISDEHVRCGELYKKTPPFGQLDFEKYPYQSLPPIKATLKNTG